jgi:hypothetical protein
MLIHGVGMQDFTVQSQPFLQSLNHKWMLDPFHVAEFGSLNYEFVWVSWSNIGLHIYFILGVMLENRHEAVLKVSVYGFIAAELNNGQAMMIFLEVGVERSA